MKRASDPLDRQNGRATRCLPYEFNGPTETSACDIRLLAGRILMIAFGGPIFSTIFAAARTMMLSATVQPPQIMRDVKGQRPRYPRIPLPLMSGQNLDLGRSHQAVVGSFKDHKVRLGAQAPLPVITRCN